MRTRTELLWAAHFLRLDRPLDLLDLPLDRPSLFSLTRLGPFRLSLQEPPSFTPPPRPAARSEAPVPLPRATEPRDADVSRIYYL